MIIRMLTFVAAAWLAMTAPAQAAESYDNCTGFINSLPATITTQGTWCLNKDVSSSMTSGPAITIAANNITLDCNHFKIGGLGAGPGTTAYGVHAASRLNATVRNCNIRGFSRGLIFISGGGHIVEDSSFDSNTRYGIYVASPGSTIRRNLVIDTGGSSNSGHAFGIYAAEGADVLDNTVNGVAPTTGNSDAFGIFTESNGNGSVTGNRVRGLAPAGTGLPYGNWNNNSDRVVVRDNDVQGPGPGVVGGVGVRCTANTGTARDNVIAGFETGISNCLLSSNIVNSN